MFFSNLECTVDEKWEKGYSKMNLYAVSPKLFDNLWRGNREPRKNYTWIVGCCVGYDKNSYRRGKKDFFFEIRQFLNLKKNVTRGKSS